MRKTVQKVYPITTLILLFFLFFLYRMGLGGYLSFGGGQNVY